MPRNNRAGKKHQARRLLKQLYYKKEFDPAIFEEYVDKDIDSTRSYKLILLTLEEGREYKLHLITRDTLPDLPRGDITSVPADLRPEFYALLRQAIWHYFYGSTLPRSSNSNLWSRYTEDLEQIKNLVREIILNIETITIK